MSNPIYKTMKFFVFIDFEVLKTLDEKEMKNGLVEMFKHSLIKNKKEIFKLTNPKKITNEMIIESIKIKREIIQKDEIENSSRIF